MQKVIMILNAGSSSIKFSIFDASSLESICNGQVESIKDEAKFTAKAKDDEVKIKKQPIGKTGYKPALEHILDWIYKNYQIEIVAAGHRVVHGGMKFFEPVLATKEVIAELEALTPLAPLHQPHSIEVIRICAELYPNLKQIACFDTAFHATQDRLARIFAIPRELSDEGVQRYGFHGLSYEYIASVMHEYIGKEAFRGKVIVAHLGNGSSMCAIRADKSVATSMGFTALDGLVMGSRCGQVDPGVVFYLMQSKGMTVEEVVKLLYNKSGLFGVSGGISNDMYVLEQSEDPKAKEAIDLYCYRAAREIASLSTAAGGCDSIVFTAGIGTNSSTVRSKICSYLDWMGVELDDEKNKQGLPGIISNDSCKVRVAIIPTNEEYMMATHVRSII